MRIPTMVYKRGSMIKHDGNHFDYLIVDAEPVEEGTKSELEKALQEGWFGTTAQALEGVPGDNQGPTRDELKEKAAELGLEYARNISTDKLAELVETALEG